MTQLVVQAQCALPRHNNRCPLRLRRRQRRVRLVADRRRNAGEQRPAAAAPPCRRPAAALVDRAAATSPPVRPRCARRRVHLALVSPSTCRHRTLIRLPSLQIGSRVVSVLDSGAEGPGFKSQSRRYRVTVLGTLFTPIVPLFTKQQNW